MPQELSLILRLKDEASAGLKGFYKELGASSKQLKIAGTAFTGFGLAILGGLVMVTKAAAEEEAGIIKLAAAMRTVGVAYEDVRGSLEALIDATQQKTAFADDQQREALSALIIITGNYATALGLLPLAMDIARAKSMDLVTAAELVGRVAQGNTGMLARYGIVLKENATATEALAALQKMFAGQAEAYGASSAGQIELLKENLGDLAEAMGTTLLPVMRDLTSQLNSLTQWFKALSPETQKAITVTTAFAGAFALIVGPILLFLGFLPQLVAGVKMVAVAFAAVAAAIAAIGVGWVIAIIAAIVALGVAGYLLWKNWDTVKEKLLGIWETIVAGAKSSFGWLLDIIGKVVEAVKSIPSWIGSKIPGFAAGGIVTQPTLAMVGEAGPEAIIPLARAGAGGVAGATYNVTLNVQGSVITERELVELVRQGLIQTGRANVTALGSFA